MPNSDLVMHLGVFYSNRKQEVPTDDSVSRQTQNTRKEYDRHDQSRNGRSPPRRSDSVKRHRSSGQKDRRDHSNSPSYKRYRSRYDGGRRRSHERSGSSAARERREGSRGRNRDSRREKRSPTRYDTPISPENLADKPKSVVVIAKETDEKKEITELKAQIAVLKETMQLKNELEQLKQQNGS